MYWTLKNYYSKYFYILSILIFIITVSLADYHSEPAPEKHTGNYTLQNIAVMSPDGWEIFCKSFNIILADVNELFKYTSKIEETHIRALKRLEDSNKKLIFYTTTMDTTASLSAKFNYPIEFELLNPITALNLQFRGKAIVIGDPNFKTMIKNTSIDIVFPSDIPYDKHIDCNTVVSGDIKAVIIGFDLNTNIYNIAQAHCYLRDPNVQLFAARSKSSFGYQYNQVWIKNLAKETNKTIQYIDQLDGAFGNFLVKANDLEDKKVLCVTPFNFESQNFTVNKGFKPLTIGRYYLKKKNALQSNWYYIENITKMHKC